MECSQGVVKIMLIALLCMVKSENKKLDRSFVFDSQLTMEDQYHSANKINDFGYKLMLTMMNGNENQNVITSPTNIANLLAMILLGSVGETYNELAQALGFSTDILMNRKNHDIFGEILRSVKSDDEHTRTLFADAIMVDKDTRLRYMYQSYVKNVYNGEAVFTDFGNPTLAKHMINEWVKYHTNGKIEDFLKQSLPTKTKVVLLSALYFSGHWENPFTPEHTRELPFQTPHGEILAKLMLNSGFFESIISPEYGLHMLALPYKYNNNKMYVIKPFRPDDLSLNDLMKRLDYSKIDGLIRQMTKKETVIRFPKMVIKSNSNLKTPLKELGIKTIFSSTAANLALMINNDVISNKSEVEVLSRINTGYLDSSDIKELLNGLPNPGVHVDTVLHDVEISIDEYGTEAYAVSAAFLSRTAELFYIESPFYIFIRNEKTKLVTFSGVIYDPSFANSSISPFRSSFAKKKISVEDGRGSLADMITALYG